MGNAVAIHRMGYPFGVYDPLGGEIKKIFHQDFGVLRHQHFAGLGLRFQAGRHIDRSAYGGVIQTAGTSEIPDITESRINSDSDFQIGGETELFADIWLQRIDAVLHFYGHIDTVFRIPHVAIGLRVAIENHNGIADEFIDGPAEFFRDRTHLRKVETQKFADLLRLDLL